MNDYPTPPKNALHFLRWFCRDEYIEEIEGNLVELFEKEHQYSPQKANRTFTLNVLRHFRPMFIRSFQFDNTLTQPVMIKHNLLLALRNFQRYKSSFFINLIGLSTGLACVLFIYLWVTDELSVDKFHEQDSQLYQIMENVDQAGGMITRQTTSGPTAQALVSEMPEVENAVTTTSDHVMSFMLSVGDEDIEADGFYASMDFFQVFSYDLVQGDKAQVLSDKKSIVISEALARSLFGTAENVVGNIIEVQHEKEYQVSGVFENVPARSSVQFDFVLTFEGFWDENEWVTNWFNTAPQTYVLFKEGTDIAQFNQKIADLVRIKTDGQADHRTPFATKYSNAYLYNQYENGVQSGGRIEYVQLFSIIALFILLIACINFMNLSTARASRRMKEVGVKKAIGARRTTLIFQYLGESLLLVFLSLLLALLLVGVFLPQFNDITEKQLTLTLDITFSLSLLGIVLLTGLVAGSYPALYLSGFNPAKVLKGKLNNLAGEVWIRKGLVVFQFTLSVILIVSVWVVYKQIEYVQNQSLGYEKDNILLLNREGPLRDAEKLNTFLEEARRIPGVLDASSSEHDMTGHNGGTYGVVWPGKDPEDRTEFERVAVGYDMIEMLGIEMQAGRSFSEEFSSENAKIIFNEAAIEFMGLTDPIGKVVQLWGEDKEIIGVAKDFHFDSFREEVKPLFFRFSPESTNYIMAKVEAGREREAIESLQRLFNDFNVGFTFNYRFLDEDYQALYVAEQRVSTLSKYFAGIAILISCLGLFGLASFMAERRLKEIGIRKVLGSSSINIVYLLSAGFTKMVLIAIFIALPISYFITQQWLQGFAFSIDLEWWYFAGAGVVALVIAWFTVGVQTIKAANVNPVQCLKDE
uniref:ABC transporter permease n=1 Tax=Roseihalotalea indica TaxID=2867963 RepID=A0AA49JD99_9BACT|nr:ABC transporter permease [Tunicatimonas sp. TK19036]